LSVSERKSEARRLCDTAAGARGIIKTLLTGREYRAAAFLIGNGPCTGYTGACALRQFGHSVQAMAALSMGQDEPGY